MKWILAQVEHALRHRVQSRICSIVFRRQIRWIVWPSLCLALCAGFLAACGSSSTNGQAATPTASAFQTTSKTTDGALAVQFSVTPDQPGTNQFTVTATETNGGQPVTQANVTLFTTMLTMNMGTDNIPMQSDGKGHFTASGLLAMNGSWQIRVAIRTADHVLHETSVQFTTRA